MANDRRPYSSEEQDSFEWIDDEERSEQPVEDEILGAEDYKGADRFGTTPAEEQRGVQIDEALAAEEEDEPPESIPDDWPEGPDPQAGVLYNERDMFAEEAPESSEQGEIHVTTDVDARAETLREAWEKEGPPPDPEDDEALDEDRDQDPTADDWR